MRRAVVVVSVAVVALSVAAGYALAQRADSGTVAVKPAPKTATRSISDSTIAGPPISPRRAFFSSLLVPGFGQSQLDRANAGALYFTVEVVSLGMIAKTKRDLGAARTTPDSVIVGYSPTDSVVVFTGGFQNRRRLKLPKPIKEPTQLGLRVRSRKVQVEDWVAVLIFNHFFSGADAFVAAQLWDLPLVLSAKPSDGGAALSAKVSW